MRLAHLLSVFAFASVLAACSSKTLQPSVYRSAVGALGPYSRSVASSDLVFVSGKLGSRGNSFIQEPESSILTLIDAVSVTASLTDLELYGEFNDIYAARLARPYPARACVEVTRLPGGARVEIQVIARVRSLVDS